MAKVESNVETIKTILSGRENLINNRTTVRFRVGDILSLILTGEGEERDAEARPTGFIPAGSDREVNKYKFLLSRGGKAFSVFVTLGAFTSLPLTKRGFAPDALERQRLGGNNAVFDGFEMRAADAVLDALIKGVKCSEVYTTSESGAQCYRWDRM